MKLLTPANPTETPAFSEDEGAVTVGPIPDAVQPRLRELEGELSPAATLTLARDWEGFIVGIVSSDEPESIESVYLTDDGKVAHGGINHPEYHPTVVAMLAGLAERVGEEFIRIVFSAGDVLEWAEDAGVEAETALARAREWGKHVQDTATALCSEQLQAAVITGQP
jgi:hypothetical protein